MGEWSCSSPPPLPRHQMEVSGKLHTPATSRIVNVTYVLAPYILSGYYMRLYVQHQKLHKIVLRYET